VIKKEVEKILKYKDLTIDTQNMWNNKTKAIPILTGATGTIRDKKSFRKYLSNIPGKREIKELQKTAMLVTGHKLRFEKYAADTKVRNVQHEE
jgi:precorrin-4 methylase